MFFRFLFCALAIPFFIFSDQGPYIEGDLLYWKANEEELSYAVGREKVLDPDYEWDFGFKFGIGYRMAHGNWDVLLRLTHLHTHTDALKEGHFNPLWIIPLEATPSVANQVKMHWRLHFALIDALLGKQFLPSARLVVYPQLGLRYGIVRQKFNIEYLIPAQEELIRMKNKFWGVGPYGCMGLEWLFSHHFSLCAKGGFAALYGQFYLHEDQDFIEGEKIFDFRDIFTRIAPIVDSTILLRWRKQWEKKSLVVQIGWDTILLLKQNRMVRYADSSLDASPIQNEGNLALKGFEGGVIFSF